MKKMSILAFLSLLFVALGPVGCSDEDSCVSLCDEAQMESCTFIKGDCANFCDAAFNVEEDAGCVDEREAYQDCLESQDVCSNSCDALENDLTNCLGSYCLTRMDSPDCKTLIASVQ